MWEYVRQKLQPRIPEDVQQDLEKAVQLIIQQEVPIDEIKLFGSLHTGKWKRGQSDIDLAVFLAMDDYRYSCYNRVVTLWTDDGDGQVPAWDVENQDRQKFRNDVQNHPTLIFQYQLHILTPSDAQRISEENSHFFQAMKYGRLLYKCN